MAAVSLAFVSALVGCTERDPVMRVQPDYVSKTDLIGTDPKHPNEWYMRSTVVDTQRGNGFAFPGTQDTLKRIRWDVREDVLVARKSYEIVSGSDGKGGSVENNDGVVVAVFPIKSHFDIRRSYNPSTGEEGNVMVENSTDRPWFERDFMRVDWSKNQVTDPEGLFWYDKIFGDVSWESVGWYDKDPNGVNHPVMETANGYFDVTQKWIAKPETMWGGYPKCWIMNMFTGSEVYECDDQEVAIRQSFMKVGTRDYVPMETSSEQWSMFGTFNRDRFGYSRQYGVLDNNWHRLVGRQNFWSKNHDEKHAECYTGDKQASNDACAAKFGAGSTCDLYSGPQWDVSGVCTMPMTKREVKTMAYYVSASMPADLWPENATLVGEWNDSVSTALALGREAECKLGGGNDCHAQFFNSDETVKETTPAITLCHNPVVKEDNKACGEVGLSPRFGDQRYSLIAWVGTPLAAAPLGYGPNGADPLTGEVVQSTSYIYGASLDNYATQARDLVLIATGDLDPATYAMGEHVPGGLTTRPITDAERQAFKGFGDMLSGRAVNRAPMGNEGIAARMSGIDASAVAAKINANVSGSAVNRLAGVQAAIAARGLEGSAGFGGRAEAMAGLASRAKLLHGTATEAEIIGNDDWSSMSGMWTTDQALRNTVNNATTPFGGSSNFVNAQTLQQLLDARLENRGECLFGENEFNAPHMIGIAKSLKAKYDATPMTSAEKGEAIYQELRKHIYRAVTEHEVGHTMALRHNFQGSWDSFNFHPNYWKLRTNNGAATAACTAARTGDNDTCMGPRYLDPETSEELGNGATPHSGVEEFAYSSIMDYGYDWNTDLHGLGTYDHAAMKFIYGNVMETFAKGSAAGEQVAGLHATADTTHARGPLSEQWWIKRNDAKTGNGFQPSHYTTVARVLQQEKLLYSADRCVASTPKNNPTGMSDINGIVCTPAPKDHAHISEFVSGDIEPGVYGSYWKTKDGRIRWPYRFSSDEASRRPHAMRFDAGADIYEGAENLARLYESRYVLDMFRRARRGWAPFLGNRQWDRYFSRAQSLGWLSATKITQYEAAYQGEATNPALESDDWGRGYALAATKLFDTLAKSVLRPEPGAFKSEPAPPTWRKPLFATEGSQGIGFNIDVLDGRYVDDDTSQEKGGSYHYGSYQERLGTHAEKPLATVALSAQFAPFDLDYSRDTYVDGRNMLLNYRSIMPAAYDRLMAGVMGADTDAATSYVTTATTDGTPSGARQVFVPEFWNDSFAFPAGAVRVDPLVGYRLQVPALIYAFYFGADDGNDAFLNSARVWVDGGSEGTTLPASEKVFFFEVGSGLTWVARNYGTEGFGAVTSPVGVGHRMIRHANQLLADVYNVQRNADGSARYNAAGELQWAGAEGEFRASATGDQKKAYQRYVGLLNSVRNLYWDFRGQVRGW